MPNPGLVWIGSSGCFLPFLIVFNLFFGRFIFNSIRLWLGIEAILILMFIYNVSNINLITFYSNMCDLCVDSPAACIIFLRCIV